MNCLALTPCCVDYYPQIDKSLMGGNSLNVAAMWRKLDPSIHVAVITALGMDKNGKMIHDFLKSSGIDTSHVYYHEGVTANNIMYVDEGGERYSPEGSWQGGVYEKFLLSEEDWNKLSEYELVAMPANNPNFREMIRRKRKDQFLSVDHLDVENKLPLEETIDYCNIAFITARKDLLSYYRDLAFSREKLLVVTLGSLGSYAYFQGSTYHQPAIQVPKVVDTTGCGDAYQAAFALNYYITKDIPAAMLAGAAAASGIAQAWGGVGNIG